MTCMRILIWNCIVANNNKKMMKKEKNPNWYYLRKYYALKSVDYLSISIQSNMCLDFRNTPHIKPGHTVPETADFLALYINTKNTRSVGDAGCVPSILQSGRQRGSPVSSGWWSVKFSVMEARKATACFFCRSSFSLPITSMSDNKIKHLMMYVWQSRCFLAEPRSIKRVSTLAIFLSCLYETHVGEFEWGGSEVSSAH